MESSPPFGRPRCAQPTYAPSRGRRQRSGKASPAAAAGMARSAAFCTAACDGLLCDAGNASRNGQLT